MIARRQRAKRRTERQQDEMNAVPVDVEPTLRHLEATVRTYDTVLRQYIQVIRRKGA